MTLVVQRTKRADKASTQPAGNHWDIPLANWEKIDKVSEFQPFRLNYAWDLAKLDVGPIVASHSAAHALCPTTRNLTDEQLAVVRGTLRRRIAAVRLERVGAVEVDQSLVGRLLGYGTLVAGPLEITYVPQPRSLHGLVSSAS